MFCAIFVLLKMCDCELLKGDASLFHVTCLTVCCPVISLAQQWLVSGTGTSDRVVTFSALFFISVNQCLNTAGKPSEI